MEGSHHISRREFITLATAAVGSLIGVVVGLPAIAYLIEPSLKTVASDTWIPLGKLENFEIGKPSLVTFTRSKVNGWEKSTLSYGAFILRKSQDEVTVFSNVCTHLSCRVNWDTDKQAYICPCHDGRFDSTGKVIFGPPPRPLDAYATKVEDGTLSIHLLES
jgi:menaquinol-cytochrome c reductase iron-sulfur subunit